MAFASEPKDLVGLCDVILPFPPRLLLGGRPIRPLRGRRARRSVRHGGRGYRLRPAARKTHRRACESASMPTRPSAFCSGRLDSSLVCAIARRELGKPIRTFAIGMDVDAIDLKYARQVAEYIGSDHTEVIITKEDVLRALPTVGGTARHLRHHHHPRQRGMYLVCKYIHDDTDVRVLLTGEFPTSCSATSTQTLPRMPPPSSARREKRVRELHMYDVLRADRCISVNSLEARVPFGDLAFVRCAMSIDPALKMNCHGHGQVPAAQGLRAGGAPAGKHTLAAEGRPSQTPWAILCGRPKSAGRGDLYGRGSGGEVAPLRPRAPFTKESLLYRELFERFYPGQSRMVADFWMPNRDWPGCDVGRPLARVLGNYGASGI